MPEREQSGREWLGETVIGAVLELGKRDRLGPGIQTLDALDFATAQQARIWEAIQGCLDAVGHVDPQAAHARLVADHTYEPGDLAAILAWWGNIAGTVNADHWARLLAEASARERSGREIEQAQIEAAGEPDPWARAEILRHALDGLTRPGGPEPDRSLTQAWEDMHSGAGERVARFGIATIDNPIRLSRSQLLIVGGEPGTGKTCLATQLALSAAEEGRRVLIVSLEMVPSAIRQRMLAYSSGIDLRALARPTGWNDAQRAEMAKALNRLDRLRNLEVIAPRPALVDILAEARARRPDVLIVDYLGLILPREKQDRRDLEIGDTVKALKRWAMEASGLCVLLSQFNRAPGKPSMSRLRDSGEIEQVADTIGLLWNPDPENRAEVELTVAKQRSGPAGDVIPLRFRGHIQRFSEA